MKKTGKILALLLGGTMTLALFAACGGGEEKNPDPTDPDPGPEPGPTESDPAGNTIICYDNLPDDGIEIPASDRTAVVRGATSLKGRDPSNRSVDSSQIATYDAATGTFTAVSAGFVTYNDADGNLGKITVVPAYATDPDYAYAGDYSDLGEGESSLLGGTHDPSFIEVVNPKSGVSTYYLFSTGWNNITTEGSGSKQSKSYGNAIHSSKDLVNWEYVGRTFDYATRTDDFVNNTAGQWMYSTQEGTTSGYSQSDASWWAPDIVECPTGGYWLYTCVVDGSEDDPAHGKVEGMAVSGYTGVYARACILLYHSDSLDAGSFKPVLFPEGHPDAGKQVVLMQSSIRRGETEKDVNGIDPQIIYDPDGKMYMAYGSFGSGDYMIELDPSTGMRKDGKGWQTHQTLRHYIDNDNNNTFDEDNIQDLYNQYKNPDADNQAIGWEHEYYGKNISKQHMEAPVIARHDNVTVSDENGQVLAENKTFYYSMHSYDGLGDNYQMWGGRSESVWGVYKSVNGGIVYNAGIGSNANQGNKYMGAFKWHGKEAGVTEYDVMLTGHNDLYTTKSGVDLAAYITRFSRTAENTSTFAVQLHQYYLNSYGDICINPNRYGGESARAVSQEELLRYTQQDASQNYKFKMVVMGNHRDTQSGDFSKISNVSVDVALSGDGRLLNAAGTQIGTWKMYGAGYIKITFNTAPSTTPSGSDRPVSSGETVYYGVVRTAWLGDQNKSGFTITCLGHSGQKMSMPLFFNNYSTISGTGLTA